MLSLSIPDLLSILLKILFVIVEIFLIYLICQWSGKLFIWIWRSLVVPIFKRRAYFYVFQEDGFYVEKWLRILWYRLRRNKRWAIQSQRIGYVEMARGGSHEDSNADKIYFVSSFGKSYIGQVRKVKDTNDKNGKVKKCEVVLRKGNEEGDRCNGPAVGYINDKGEVYKYYKDLNDARKGKLLGQEMLIGYARAPQLGKMITESGSYDTDEEAAVKGIKDTAESSKEWMFFRRRRKNSVRCQEIDAPSANRGNLKLWAGGWRVLHAHQIDCNPDRKLRPWGIGYAKEDFWRNRFTNADDTFGLDARAVAALLLAEKEGFVLQEGEQGDDGRKGFPPTALFSLVCYLLIFPLLNMWIALSEWFPFVGEEISRIISLILLFFGLWMAIVHPIRVLLYDGTNRFESLLNKINNNVGSSSWCTALIITSILGIILSIFWIHHVFFAVFFVTLVAVVVNRVYYPPVPWGVEDDWSDGDSGMDGNSSEEECDEEIEHKAKMYRAGGGGDLIFKIPYQKEQLQSLRVTNPFRDGCPIDYSQGVKEMIAKEMEGEVYSKIAFVSDIINKYVKRNHLSYIEKVSLILKLSQPENIEYHYDWNSEELLPQSGEDGPKEELLKPRSDGKDGKGYIEYCRYPTETLHDRRGDCDCHAALAVGLLSACGIRCCYLTNTVDDGTGHAALGIESNDYLRNFANAKNSFEYSGINFIYVEATGEDMMIGEVPEGFQAMLQDNDEATYAIIEPFIGYSK